MTDCKLTSFSVIFGITISEQSMKKVKIIHINTTVRMQGALKSAQTGPFLFAKKEQLLNAKYKLFFTIQAYLGLINIPRAKSMELPSF